VAKKYFIKTFGCQANEADSERVAGYLEEQGLEPARLIKQADWVVINTCMVRQMAEDRVYGLLRNLETQKGATGRPGKIIVTGCLTGMAVKEKSGNMLYNLRETWPMVDEWLAIEEVGFENQPIRTSSPPSLRLQRGKHAWIPISNGCNNYCTFCVVPFTRGREVSRPFEEIIKECRQLESEGVTAITLLGQNVNSYRADLVTRSKRLVQVQEGVQKERKDGASKLRSGQVSVKFLNRVWNDGQGKLMAERRRSVGKQGGRENELQRSKVNITSGAGEQGFVLPSGEVVKPVMVKHLGRMRIPTLFPALLETICLQCPKITQIEFVSSNPWDFSDELIEVIARFSQISRRLHLPVQSGANKILKAMNRWYSREEYLELVGKIKQRIPEVELTTDIIVGFPEETKEDFEQTVDLVKQVGFVKSYTARYSPRPMTAAGKLADDVPYEEKKRRWKTIDRLVNKKSME
jgi:tRNA A37 methylthiotransferase MiaB